MPGELFGQEDAFGVGHQDRGTAVCAGESGDGVVGAVGVERIGLRDCAVIIDVLQGRELGVYGF